MKNKNILTTKTGIALRFVPIAKAIDDLAAVEPFIAPAAYRNRLAETILRQGVEFVDPKQKRVVRIPEDVSGDELQKILVGVLRLSGFYGTRLKMILRKFIDNPSA